MINSEIVFHVINIVRFDQKIESNLCVNKNSISNDESYACF